MKVSTAVIIVSLTMLIGLLVISIEDLRSPSRAIKELSKSGEVVLYTIDYEGEKLNHLIYSDNDSVFTEEEVNNLSFLGKYYIVRVK